MSEKLIEVAQENGVDIFKRKVESGWIYEYYGAVPKSVNSSGYVLIKAVYVPQEQTNDKS